MSEYLLSNKVLIMNLGRGIAAAFLAAWVLKRWLWPSSGSGEGSATVLSVIGWLTIFVVMIAIGIVGFYLTWN